jgi:hypothetical protein
MSKCYETGNPPNADAETRRRSIERQDRAAGHRDRLYGTYNEWYRLNRADRGRAYETGWRAAEKAHRLSRPVVRIYV